MSSIEIKQTNGGTVRPLRHKILRPGQAFHTTILPRDDEKTTRHFALYLKGKLGSVASIFPEELNEYPGKNAYRLRGMATVEENQGVGFGTAILHYVIQCLMKETDAELLWCNARETAFGFYEKFGFEIIGETFDIENIGPHKKGFYKIERKQ
ncbi:MAG: GNAT family N-acetyltransferase [Candidatus Marinimicrobia bacterium]|jgi:predicted GNAT family N-acyltransferase|nr:GNAT family N-acetyltransferase [Candidatus Neomarinimicrobiota bacterium]MBT4145170.1 GNAT family N-acetyltransferase [Candidatus Neomarinimicrobiota bacterium]MBT4176971.1 GNAT family N-acetyltransferase [Candidatus Neomarinimicrobiota bacterium]MBT4593697.1 GNAT family N-acetyltransferase [Candidatus Neomarinimicrobiota bacterium]MBT4990598.1 GNAT family N-acetyltransferase [Candidatus Neomarinimicrobiota bacterium]